MKRRRLPVALVVLMVLHPVAAQLSWAAMAATRAGAATPPHAEMQGDDRLPAQHVEAAVPGCHAVSSMPAIADATDCCDRMAGSGCGMDCGSPCSAVNQAMLPPPLMGHGAFNPEWLAATPDSPSSFLFKPPRTS